MPRKRAAKPVTALVLHQSPQLAELVEAAKSGRFEPLQRFLAAGGLPDTLIERKFTDGSTTSAPLIFKAVSTHCSVQNPALHHAGLELLLESGANANAICIAADGHEDTALMAACSVKCCTAPVRLLLAHGADPALQTSKGNTALHSAASAGHADICKVLLEAGCGPDEPNRNGLTPLGRAVHKGHVPVVELLHKQWGADLNISNANGETLLHLAAASGQRPMLQYLMRNGLNANTASHNAVTPARMAAEAGNTEAVQTLLEHGASATVVDSHGDNLLIVAVRQGHTDVVQLLLSSDSSNDQQALDVNAVNVDGRTALHIAASKDRTAAAALLLQHGAAVNAPDNNGYTALEFAAAHSSAELVQLLLDAGAELTGDSPALHASVLNSNGTAVLTLLLEQSAAAAMMTNVAEQCSCCGPRTAVMLCEQPEQLKLLLAAGADAHATTDKGNTALHVAAVHKHPASVLCLLIKAGVDLHAENIDGKTAAQVAAESGNTLAAQLLTRAARDS
eukprot:19119-Heterococcus_DN1.PRE.2